MKGVLSLVALMLAMSTAYASDLCEALQANPPSISASMQLSADGQSSTMNVVLTNHAGQDIPSYTLYFNSDFGVTSVSGASFQLIHGQNGSGEGDLWGIESTAPVHSSVTIPVVVATDSLQLLSFFRGFFMVAQEGTLAPCAPINIKAVNNILPPYHPSLATSDYKHYQEEATTSIEGNTPKTVIIADSTDRIIPKPVLISATAGALPFTLSLRTNIVIKNSALQASAQYLQQILRSATGYPLTIRRGHPVKSNDAIVLRYRELKAQGLNKPEAYTLSVNKKNIIITANPGDSEAIFDGIQTLRQLLPPQIFDMQINNNTIWQVPAVEVQDYPRFLYRGFMLDSARHFQPPVEIEHVLDMMALNKLNYFYWHLGDDEGFRFSVDQYPALSTIGAWRGFNFMLQPTLGSGADVYGGFYSQQDIANILAYAKTLHITVIPEIDMPGHARALVKSLPGQMEDPNDQSYYTSVQGYSDNVINPCVPGSMDTIKNVLLQMAALFPDAPYIGVGGDEVPNGVWMGSPMCKVFMQQHELTTEQQVFDYFFASQIQPIVESTGKKVIGWGDFVGSEVTAYPDTLPSDQILKTDAVVLPWSVYQNDPQSQTTYNQNLVAATNLGYGVVEAPAANLYFDLAYSPNPNEIGQHWAGYLDTVAVYSTLPIPTDFAGNAQKILGVQGNLWGEFNVTQANLDYLTLPKMAALAEVAWTQPNLRDWNDFGYRMAHDYFPILDQMNVGYRVSPPGVVVIDGQLIANAEFTVPVQQRNGSIVNENPELSIHYTTDGSAPTAQSPVFNSPQLYLLGAQYQFVACNPVGRCSYVVTPVVN